jgi:hypothetical protein
VSPPQMMKTLLLMIVMNKLRLPLMIVMNIHRLFITCFWERLVPLFWAILCFIHACICCCQTLNPICGPLILWFMLWWPYDVEQCMLFLETWSLSGFFLCICLSDTWSFSGDLVTILWSSAWSFSGCCLYSILHVVGNMHGCLSPVLYP